MTRSSLRKRRRFRRQQVRTLVRMAPIASAIAAALQPTVGQEQSTAGGLQEVVVTAEKRSESLQNVPLSVVAIGTEQLENLNVQSQDDYVKFLPSVTTQKSGSGGGANGPGFGNVIMRGISSDAGQNHSGPLPTVGTYLDEQPVTTIQGAMDVHLYDIARVEALAGPQGTLYGASSEAGTLRIITNKPDPSAFKAEYQLEGNYVDHGRPGGLVQGFVNVPLSPAAAVRLVGWYQHDGGYIDNVRATRTFPQFGITIDNAPYARNHFNDTTIYGGRAALKVDLDDNWSITPFVMAQSTKANGFNAYAADFNAFAGGYSTPNVGDLQLEHFSPDGLEDRFVDTALTIEGKLSNFDLVYAGAFLKRHDLTHTDYSDYSLAYDISAPSYTSPIVDNSGRHINPTQTIAGRDGYEKLSNELRLQSPQDWRVHFIVGGFYQRQMHNIEQDYQIANLAQALWVTGWPDSWWLTKQQRVDRDYAAFGEATWDITSSLSLLAGIRHFKYDNSLEGYRGYGLNNPLGAASGLGEAGVCDFSYHFQGAPCLSFDKSTSGTGNTPKLTLTYKFDSQRLVYVTYSKGFRPGGINRVGNLPPYQADFLKNYELGWKTTWLDNHLRYNGAVFREDWNNFQFAFLGANGLTRIANAGAARVTGIENELAWAVSHGLTVSAGLTILDPRLTENYCGAITADGSPITDCPSPAAPKPPQAPEGQQLPGTSKVKGNLVARYDFPIGELQGYGQGAFVYQSGEWSDLRTKQREEIGIARAFGTLDLSAGVAHNNCYLDLFLTNAFDKRGQLFRFNQCASCSIVADYAVPTQPRTIALRLSQRF
ncbi:MAG: TonB-dependent receptor [Gammaproteobacteria bacterium]|nr:TonB-dependent receptor [Gammaproteobacteria bacterium]